MNRRSLGVETIRRLQDWDMGSAASERLASRLLLVDGFEHVDPIHPRGGPDGQRDVILCKDEVVWIAAVYFADGQQQFGTIKRKFTSDLDGLGGGRSFAFVTNQRLSDKQRSALKKTAEDRGADCCEIYHVERIAAILDTPRCYGLRSEFLNISPNKSELISVMTPESTDETYLEHAGVKLVLNRDFDSFTLGEQKSLLQAIQGILSIKSPPACDIDEGSVILTLRNLTKSQAILLLEAVERGELDDFDISDASLLATVETPKTDSNKVQPRPRKPNRSNVVSVILAGGKGSRLEPLTRDRTKPAVPFGGAYRFIDFVLSNCLNSGLRRIFVLSQYKSLSLQRHMKKSWEPCFSSEVGEFIDLVPPQQRIDDRWYVGTADALYQNIYTLESESPDYVLVLPGDHIYKQDYSRLIDYHIENRADLTVGSLRVRYEDARSFDIIEVDGDNRIVSFEAKPFNPKCIPGDNSSCWASMGVYVFSARFLFEILCHDAVRFDSTHDFSRDVIPSIVDSYRVFASPFRDEFNEGSPYWRDIGTIDAYYEASMDLVSVAPQFNLHDENWPIRVRHPSLPPSRFVLSDPEGRTGHATDSVVSLGCVISGGHVERSVIGNNVRLNSYSHVEGSVLLDGVHIGRHARIRRAIIEERVQIPAGMVIGFNTADDLANGFTVTEYGITVVTQSPGSNQRERTVQFSV